MSVFGAIMVRIFLTFSRIRTEYGKHLSVFNLNAGKCEKNTDQNNSEYRHFLRSENIVIHKADWGNTIVILRNTSYINEEFANFDTLS